MYGITHSFPISKIMKDNSHKDVGTIWIYMQDIWMSLHSQISSYKSFFNSLPLKHNETF